MQKYQPRIAIVVDNPLRDLPGICLLTFELSRRGCTVFLLPMYFNDEALSLAPDLILLNYLRKVSKGLAEVLLNNDIQVGVLDTEGGPTSDISEALKYLCDDVDVNHRVAPVCSWGSFYAEEFLRRKTHPEEAVKITGQPRFDLYAPPWRDAIVRMSRHIPPPAQPYVLVCSNFGLTTSKYASREQMRHQMTANYGVDQDKFEAMQDEEEICIKQMVDCVLHLSSVFPETKIVYRPHPFEDPSSYSAKFLESKNIAITKEGSIAAWMIAAKVVIQLTCTTCYDAWFAGTPSFRPGWIVQTSGTGYHFSVNHACATMEDLVANVSSALESSYQPDAGESLKNSELVEKFFGTPDGKAHVRVADSILNSLDFSKRPKRMEKLGGLREAIFKNENKKTFGVARFKEFFLSKMKFQNGWTAANLKARKKLLKKYLGSEKYFDARTVQEWMNQFGTAAQIPGPRVSWARDTGEYLFGSRHGQAIVVKNLHPSNRKSSK